jgi:WD40 repeat protein
MNLCTHPKLLDGQQCTKPTCLASDGDVLVTGGFHGEYAYVYLGAERTGAYNSGSLTTHYNGISNHVHAFRHRTSAQTQAAFCSNDSRMRVLDCATNRIVQSFDLGFQINASATAPDGRLRVVVGDKHDALIIDTDTGTAQANLPFHKEDAFACAWSDDSRFVATAAQDDRIAVYDTRNFSRTLAVLGTEYGYVRSLRFSPTGSGAQVLVAAENDDAVHVFDTAALDKRQSITFFGSVAGCALSPGGERLYIASDDSIVGGLFEFERAADAHSLVSTMEWMYNSKPYDENCRWDSDDYRKLWENSDESFSEFDGRSDDDDDETYHGYECNKHDLYELRRREGNQEGMRAMGWTAADVLV